MGHLERVLAIDVGGSKVKMLVTGESEPRKAPSGSALTPARFVELVRELAGDWRYDAVSIGYPGLVGETGPCSEPGYLGQGWVGFDYASAFGRPVRILNDAAMQALGSYDGGRMLFLGLGTGLGSALIVEHVLITLELGTIRAGRRKLSEVLGRAGLKRLGRKAWRAAVEENAAGLMAAFLADYVVLGGGNAKELDPRRLAPGMRLGNNLTAFRGGFRLWQGELQAQAADGDLAAPPRSAGEWRLL